MYLIQSPMLNQTSPAYQGGHRQTAGRKSAVQAWPKIRKCWWEGKWAICENGFPIPYITNMICSGYLYLHHLHWWAHLRGTQLDHLQSLTCSACLSETLLGIICIICAAAGCRSAALACLRLCQASPASFARQLEHLQVFDLQRFA